jgi:uncharacterized membrane protein (UPF0127 family)
MIKNKKGVIAKEYRIAGCFGKIFGLMFSRARNLVFAFDGEEKRGLHMLFVFYPIDVLFLDKNKRVVEKARLRPFQFYNSRRRAQYVIELKNGLAKDVRIEDKISF